MKVLKACCRRNGEKNNNKHIVAIQSMKTTKFIPSQSEKLSIHQFDKPMCT